MQARGGLHLGPVGQAFAQGTQKLASGGAGARTEAIRQAGEPPSLERRVAGPFTLESGLYAWGASALYTKLPSLGYGRPALVWGEVGKAQQSSHVRGAGTGAGGVVGVVGCRPLSLAAVCCGPDLGRGLTHTSAVSLGDLPQAAARVGHGVTTVVCAVGSSSKPAQAVRSTPRD